MDTFAVLFEQPEQLTLRRLPLIPPTPSDIVVETEWSGISTGTERLLWNGRMPPFPGLGYPLVPGYETVGRVVEAGRSSGHLVGARVFVPGSRNFEGARGLFGGAASRLVVAGSRAVAVDDALDERGVLLALAATAWHAVVGGTRLPDLVIGHGALGRLVARCCAVLQPGAAPTVWETNPARRDGATGYRVCDPAADDRRDYACICDVSGDARLLDTLIARLAPGGEVVLAGFYSEPLAFAFPPAFMKEARLRVAAEWKDADLAAVADLANAGTLSLDGLVTHRAGVRDAADAYRTAFGDASCIKMILDWRASA